MEQKTYGPVNRSLDTPVYGGVNNLAREQWAKQYNNVKAEDLAKTNTYYEHTRFTNRATTTPMQHALILLKGLSAAAIGITAAKLTYLVWFVF